LVKARALQQLAEARRVIRSGEQRLLTKDVA
jgi:hypothetical protein